MKTPLYYQKTKYDCGPVAVLNAISYIYNQEEIPSSFLKEVYNVCLDEGSSGTSNDAMKFLASWFNLYSKKTGFPIQCSYFENEDVTFMNNLLINQLKDKNTAIVLRCKLYDEHFVTVTDTDADFIYLFDPYFYDGKFDNPQIVKIDEPMKTNRKLPINFMETTTESFYSMRNIEKIAIIFKKS